MDQPDWMIMMEKMQEIRHFCGLNMRRHIKGAISSAQELDLLSRIDFSGENLTPQMVCSQMGITKPMCSRLIEGLEKKELVEKVKSTRDRRSYYLVITKKGREEVKQTYTYYLEPVYRLRRGLGSEKFELLIDLIREANERTAWEEGGKE